MIRGTQDDRVVLGRLSLHRDPVRLSAWNGDVLLFLDQPRDREPTEGDIVTDPVGQATDCHSARVLLEPLYTRDSSLLGFAVEAVPEEHLNGQAPSILTCYLEVLHEARSLIGRAQSKDLESALMRTLDATRLLPILPATWNRILTHEVGVLVNTFDEMRRLEQLGEPSDAERLAEQVLEEFVVVSLRERA